MNIPEQLLEPGNLIGYPFRAHATETTRAATEISSHLPGDNEEDSPSVQRHFGAEVYHLIGDMTLEEDSA